MLGRSSSNLNILVVVESLHYRRQSGRGYCNGQEVVLAGSIEMRKGKSCSPELIVTPLLGGRSAKPYQFMSGQTAFNANLFEAEHLMIEDDVACSEHQARRSFGSASKQISSNSGNSASITPKTASSLTMFAFLGD